MTLLLNEGQAGGMEACGQVDRNLRAVLERRADPREVIEVFVADDQRLDLALLQEPVDALLGEATSIQSGFQPVSNSRRRVLPSIVSASSSAEKPAALSTCNCPNGGQGMAY